MTNQSIKDAFSRFWNHIISKFVTIENFEVYITDNAEALDQKPGRKMKGTTYTDAEGNILSCSGGEVFSSYKEDIVLDSSGRPTNGNLATANCSTAMGDKTKATGTSSIATGYKTQASGTNSVTMGSHTVASGASAVAMGTNTTASGTNAIAAGLYSEASGEGALVLGTNTQASAYNSIAVGSGTKAASRSQFVQGEYNIEDTLVDDPYAHDKRSTYAHIVGNGDANGPSNAYTLDWNGNGWFEGNVKVGGTSQDDSAAKTLATEDYVDEKSILTLTLDTPYELNSIPLTTFLPQLDKSISTFRLKFTNNVSGNCGFVLPVSSAYTSIGYVTLKEAELKVSAQRGVVTTNAYSVYFELHYCDETYVYECLYNVSDNLPYSQTAFGEVDIRFTQSASTLLWSNSSPSATYAGFSPISLDLNKYRFISVWYREYASDERLHMTSLVPVGVGSGTTNETIANATVCYGFADNKLTRRYCYATTNQVIFGDGGYKTSITTNYNSGNNYLIPVRIYGIR